jgi:dolichol kinase
MIRALALAAALVLAPCLKSFASFVDVPLTSAQPSPVNASGAAASLAAPRSTVVSLPTGFAPIPGSLTISLSPALSAAAVALPASAAPLAVSAQISLAPALSAAAAVSANAAPLPGSAQNPALSAASSLPNDAARLSDPTRKFLSAARAASAELPPDADPAAAKAVQDRLFGENGASASSEGYAVQVSQPGKIGRLLRHIWPAHTLFRVGQDRIDVDSYLPATLNAFPQPNPSWLTRLKKNILFSPPVVAVIRWQLAHDFRRFEGRSDGELFDSLQTHSSESPNKYNIVIERGGFNVMKLNHGSKIPDWILSKHVLMSGYSKDVRFAGELWKSADGTIHLSDNSGTYRPSVAQLEQAAAYLKAVFPGIDFVIEPQSAVNSAPAQAPPDVQSRNGGGASLRDRIAWIYEGGSDLFKKEVRRKTFHQKNWGYLLAFLLLGYPLSAYALGGFTATIGVVEVLRMKWDPMRRWTQRHFGDVLRAKEATRFTGMFYGALGVATSVALYGWSKPLVAAGILAYTVGDAVSPLVGMRFGWKPYTIAGTKRSLDGTLAGFAVVLAMILALGFSPLVALGGALAFSAVDTYPVKPDDNFWIPVAVSSALFLLGRL